MPRRRKMPRRDTFVTTRLTVEENEKLAGLAKATYRSKSTVLRLLLALAQLDAMGNIAFTPIQDRR